MIILGMGELKNVCFHKLLQHLALGTRPRHETRIHDGLCE